MTAALVRRLRTLTIRAGTIAQRRIVLSNCRRFMEDLNRLTGHSEWTALPRDQAIEAWQRRMAPEAALQRVSSSPPAR